LASTVSDMTGLSVGGAERDGRQDMNGFERYALYWAPDPGPLADFAAAWLGWDAAGGHAVAHPDLPGLPLPLAEITATPRIYGFHGTVKPPFRLAPGTDAEGLHAAAAALCTRLAPVTLPGLALHRLVGFVALTPDGDAGPLAALAAEVVAVLDPFRAPPTEAEIARRRPDRLTDRQRAHLAQWGYPYVMEDFQFHLTLSGDLTEPQAKAVATALTPVLDPILPRPFRVDSLCLFGQGSNGMFRLLHRYTLSG
jgi:putative phosphonate metabolism protein